MSNTNKKFANNVYLDFHISVDEKVGRDNNGWKDSDIES